MEDIKWDRDRLFNLDREIERMRKKINIFKPYDEYYQEMINIIADRLDLFFNIIESENISYYESTVSFYKELKEKYETQINNYNKGLLERPDKTILIFYGPSASGKSSVVFNLEKYIPRLITHTSRKKRVGEVDGYDYHFVDKSKFKDLNLVEEPENYDNANYGLSKKELDHVFNRSDVASVVMTKNGIYALSRYSEYDIRPIYVTAPLDTIADRLKEADKSLRTYEEKFNRLYDTIKNWRYAETDITDTMLNTKYLDEEECVKSILDLLDKIGVDYNGKDKRDMS